MFVISYDISETRLRNKIAKTLENYGHRVQYSVFECDIDKDKYKELYEKLAVLTANEEDVSIRFYHICRNCMQKLCILGELPDYNGDTDGIIII